MRKIVVLALTVGLLAFGLGDASVAHADGAVHVVQPGETLYSIAGRYGVTVQQITAANGIYNPDYVQAGQRLSIPGGSPVYRPAPSHPAPGGAYRVRPGDTLYSIAWEHGTTISALMAANHLKNPDWIYAGQTLQIPGHYAPPKRSPDLRCGYRYHVEPGDTLSAIAWRTGTTTYALARANGLRYPYIIYSGQRLHIPCDAGSAPPRRHPKHPAPAPKKPTPRPDLHPAACARAVEIVRPLDKAHVSGTVHIVGTAAIDDFQFYKLEYAAGHNPLDSAFASINEEHRTPVSDSTLAVWYVGNLPAGKYTLRLTAVDNTGNFPRPCDVRLHINE